MTNNPMTAGLAPTHPGEILREDILPAVKESKAQVARLLKVSRQTLYAILNGEQAVTTPIALKLGKLTGTAPQFWLNMQNAYDLRVTGDQLAGELEQIPHLVMA